MKATYKNQLDAARKLLDEKGSHALVHPHGRTGALCGCQDCFSCAAWQVWHEYLKKSKEATLTSN